MSDTKFKITIINKFQELKIKQRNAADNLKLLK